MLFIAYKSPYDGQVTFIYEALFTIQMFVSKQLYRDSVLAHGFTLTSKVKHSCESGALIFYFVFLLKQAVDKSA